MVCEQEEAEPAEDADEPEHEGQPVARLEHTADRPAAAADLVRDTRMKPEETIIDVNPRA
jgi:hypothetical protein